MNKRALLIALIIGAIGLGLMLLYTQRFEQQASGGPRVDVLVAVKPIERGSVVTQEHLSTRSIPQAYVESRAVRAVDQSKVLGLRVGYTVRPQYTLMWTDLAITADERRDLSSLIEQGRRAVSIVARQGDKSFSMIRPGDYVDLIATLPDQKEMGKKKSVVLLQKVLVLAVGLETKMESSERDQFGPRMREMVLTLSVGLNETQLITLGLEHGELTVVLRNPDDQLVTAQIPDMPESALTDKEKREEVQKARSVLPVKLEAGGR